MENDPKNPHKTASLVKNVENVELLWKLKPLVYIHNRPKYPCFPHFEIFFEKNKLKKYFSSFFVETWKPLVYTGSRGKHLHIFHAKNVEL